MRELCAVLEELEATPFPFQAEGSRPSPCARRPTENPPRSGAREQQKKMLDTLLAGAAMLAAVVSACYAFLSYRLSKGIQNDLKRDERVVVGPLRHPDLSNENHRHCVVACTLFNKSHRKAFVNSVRALDENREEIDIKWASRIDHLGNPQEPFGVVGVVDSVNLYVRRNDGAEIDYVALEIKHSFPDSPVAVKYDPGAGWLP